MNWASARSRRASGPHSTANRALAILTARSMSSSPSASPTSSCGLGVKANSRGVPQRRTSTLSASLLPGGTEGCGTFGTWSEQRFDRVVDGLELGVERLDPLGDLRASARALSVRDGAAGALPDHRLEVRLRSGLEIFGLP